MSVKKIYALAVLLFATLLLMPTAFAQPKKSNLQDFKYDPDANRSGPVDKRAAVNGNRKLRAVSEPGDELAKKKSNPKKPLYALGLAMFLILGCSPLALKLFRENKERLNNQNAFGRNPEGVGEPVYAPKKRTDAGGVRAGSDPRRGRRNASSDSNALARTDEDYGASEKPAMPLVSPEELHEKVWYTLADSGKWLTAESVARMAKLDLEQVREELAALAEEQHIDSTKDRVGRPMYKFIS